jgi:hypothetical protein
MDVRRSNERSCCPEATAYGGVPSRRYTYEELRELLLLMFVSNEEAAGRRITVKELRERLTR